MTMASARLIFDMDKVKELIEHARSCAAHSPSGEMHFDPAFWKEGVKPDAFGMVASEGIDPAKVPAHLKLVKEDSVYLMSSGLPGLPSIDGESKLRVVRAYQLGPGMAHTVDHAVGHGDFSLPIFLDSFGDHARLRPELLAIDIDETGCRVERPSFPINADQLREAKGRAGDLSMKHTDAQPGKTYIGRICGFDSHHVFQAQGRKMIIHHRELLGSASVQLHAHASIAYGPGDLSAPAIEDFGFANPPGRARPAARS
jgi:hypothetical protein